MPNYTIEDVEEMACFLRCRRRDGELTKVSELAMIPEHTLNAWADQKYLPYSYEYTRMSVLWTRWQNGLVTFSEKPPGEDSNG